MCPKLRNKEPLAHEVDASRWIAQMMLIAAHRLPATTR
jgi:hypothetical protein